MSDTASAQGAAQDTGPVSGETAQVNPQPDTGQPVDVTSPPSQEASLYEEYLKDVEDEVQRKLLEPRVKQWDAMVTKKFQQIHDQYKPYKESGLPAESAAQAAQLLNMIQSDPQRVFAGLAQALGYNHLLQPQSVQPIPQQQPQVQPQPGQQQTQLNPFEELDPAIAPHLQALDERYQQQEKLLQQMATLLIAKERSQTQAQTELQLDMELKALKQKYGDYDENYVLTQMYAGMTGEQAVQRYQQLVQQAVNQAAQANPTQPSPPFMGGGSMPPQENFDPRKAGKKDLQATVASLIAAAQQA